MSTKIIRQNKLTRAEVDKLSEEIDALLKNNDTEKTMRMRIRYTLEDMILTVCERLGEDTSYTLITGSSFKRPFIRFLYEGSPFDPCSSDDPLENWSNRIMSDKGISPVWQYKNGVNSLEIKLKRKHISSMGTILLGICMALILGFLGAFLLPNDIKTNITEMFIRPCQNVFFNLMRVFSGLMILLSVSCGIFNMGDMSSFSRIGKLMFRRYISFTVIIAAAISAVCYFLFPSASNAAGLESTNTSGLSDIVHLVFDIVPSDIISPFSTGNAMQIVLISVIIGVAILLLGEKTQYLKKTAEDLNTLILSIMSFICKLLPFYIFFIFIDMIWSDKFIEIVNVWKPFIAASVISLLMLTGNIIYVSFKLKVGISIIIKKLSPTFLTAVTTASTLAAFSQTINNSTTKFGVDENYVKVAHPITNVIYMPPLLSELLVMIYCMAQIYDIQISISWIVLGILISSILTIAAPPIPGTATLLFGIIFSQMGIPAEAMAFAVTCDIFYDFLDSAVINSMGMMEYILQADKLNMLDKEVLRKEIA